MDGLLRIEPCIVCRGEQAHRSTASAFVYAAVAARAAGRREASHRVTVWIRNFGGCSSLNVPLLQRHSIYTEYIFRTFKLSNTIRYISFSYRRVASQ